MKSEKEVVARIERLEQAKAVKQQEVAAIESEFKRLQDAHAQALEWIKGAEYSIAELRETLNPQVDKEAAPEEVEAVDADPIAAPPELFDKPKKAASKKTAAAKR